MSQRSDQVAGLVREAVQKILAKGLHDPRVRGLITVTRVVCSDDLRSCTVYVSVMPAEHRDLTMHGLKAAAGHIRHQLGDMLALRKTPELLIKPDTAASRQADVLDAIAQAANEPKTPAVGWGAPEANNQADPASPPAGPEPEANDEPQ